MDGRRKMQGKAGPPSASQVARRPLTTTTGSLTVAVATLHSTGRAVRDQLQLELRMGDLFASEFDRFRGLFPQVVEDSFSTLEAISKLGRVVRRCDKAHGARDRIACLQLTDCVNGLVAAQAARERERVIVEEARHPIA